MSRLPSIPLIAPMVTPYDDELRIDAAAAEALAARLAGEGVGVLAAGTTGEMTLLLPEEKRGLVQAAARGASGRVPVYAGSGWPNPRLVVEEVGVLAEAGASAALVPPPFYYPIPQRSVMDFYRLVAGSVRIPVIIYTIPSHAKVEVAVETIASLTAVEGVEGVKATVPDAVFQARLIREAKKVNPRFLVYSGIDDLLLYNLASGGDGGVAAGLNLTPKLHAELVEEWRSGNTAAAGRLNRLVNLISWVLEPARTLQGGIKTILVYEGLIGGDAVRPPLPLEDEASRRQVIERWRGSGLRDYF